MCEGCTSNVSLSSCQYIHVQSTGKHMKVTEGQFSPVQLKLQWATKGVTLFGIEALVLFYLHLALIFRYPQPHNSMLCRSCDLC